jgi:putative ABC transport system permease protein
MRASCRVFLHRLAALFRWRHFEDDLAAELGAHLEMAVDLNLRRGMTIEEARREALRALGGVDQIKEGCRRQRGLPLIETTLQDLRFGLRILRRSPGFSLLAILCLTLGIGANATVFSWIEGVLLRPYPLIAHQERMLALVGTSRGSADQSGVSWPDFLDLERNCTLIETAIAEKITGTTLGVGDRAERATGSIVSANYFDALGIRPILGRGFVAGEDTGRNAHPVTVISYRTWKDRYQGDEAIIGRTQTMEGVRHTIIGVAPEGFYGTFVGYAFQFWVPLSMQATFDSGGYALEDRGARWIEGFVRLKPGVTRGQAQQEISTVASRLEVDYPDTNRGRGFRLYALWQTPFNNAGALAPTLGILFAVAVLVLLIACANVGNLLIVRSLARHREMTIRLAVGAGRGRLVRQLFTEGLILSVIATAGGLVVALWCRELLVRLIPWRGVPMYLPGQLDGRVFTWIAGVGFLATLLFALVPAFQTRGIDLVSALKAETTGVVGGRGKERLRSGLVVIQVSLSFLLLVGAGLVVRSLGRIRSTSPGFSTQGVLVTSVDLPSAEYDTQRAKTFQDDLMARVRALPGVEDAAFGRIPPFSLWTYSSAPIAVDGYQAPPDQQPTVDYDEVGPGYFATMGIPLISGREFTRADDESAPLVAIVNEAMVGLYWRGGDPVGRRLQVKDRWMQVVGVARLSKYRNFLEAPRPLFYVPLRQNFSQEVALNIRTRQPPEAMAAALSREVHALDPELPLYEMITMRERIDRSTSPQRVAVASLTVLGGLALLLASIGLYGVMACAVSQRRRELALRMALGARAFDLLRLVMTRGLVLMAGGLAVGAAAAVTLTRLLGYLLYDVSPFDVLAFASALAVIATASVAACVVPAWRAARTDPALALRE